MKYNIIGDVHSRGCWRDVVREDCINIFVGDYFDPYGPYPFETQMEEFMGIIQYAKTNPDTVLLLGNHDLHYFHKDDHSRLNARHANEIKQAFLDNIHLFNIAHSIENKVLVTHAGVTTEWLKLSGWDTNTPPTPDTVRDHIESLFWDGFIETSTGERYFSDPYDKGMKYFMFTKCCDSFDTYGTTPTQSPVWIRPQTLVQYNALVDFVQVVGHTQVDHIEQIPYPIWLVDCLGWNPMSLIVDTTESLNFTTNVPRKE